MKKKYLHTIALALTLALSLWLLAGCSSSSSEQSSASASPASGDTAAQSGDEAESEEVYDDELAAIQQSGKFVVGIEGTYPPFTYHDDNGDLVGLDVELAKAIAEKLGVEAEFEEAAWDSLLAGVDSGRFDAIINCVGASDERKEKYDFSDPYLYISRQIVVRKGDDSIKTIEDLDGKTIATNLTNVYATWFEEHGATIVPVDTSSEAATLLLTGRVDFLSFNPVVLHSYLEEHGEAEMEVAFDIPDSEEQVAIPMRKGETRLVEAVNQALKELSEDGTLEELSNRYIGSDFTKSAADG